MTDTAPSVQPVRAWQPIETAPKDGTVCLFIWDNGCGWEYVVAWWGLTAGPNYPWVSHGTAYPEDKFDYWAPLPEPPLRR